MPNAKCQMPNREQGYTLIEILVVLTIIGMLFGFGFASFRDFSRRQAVSGVGKLIQGDLRLAQQQALSGQKPGDDARCKSPNSLSGYTFTVNSPSQYSIAANCTGGSVTVKTIDLPGGITISMTPSSAIEFKVLGHGTNIISGGNSKITISQSGTNNTMDVIVSSSGEIK